MRFLGTGKQEEDGVTSPLGSQYPLRGWGKVLGRFLSAASHLNILSLYWSRTSRLLPPLHTLWPSVLSTLWLLNRFSIRALHFLDKYDSNFNKKDRTWRHFYQLPLLPTIRLAKACNNTLASWIALNDRALWLCLDSWSWWSPLPPAFRSHSVWLVMAIHPPRHDWLTQRWTSEEYQTNQSHFSEPFKWEQKERKLVSFWRWHHTMA